MVSDELLIVCSVPQGSILCPLLFTVYVNDLLSVSQNCSSECYVDDTKLYASFRLEDCQYTATEMNCDLVRVRNWCFKNHLLLNPEKTKLMVFGSRQMRSRMPDFRLSLLGKDIVPSLTIKGLRVTL